MTDLWPLEVNPLARAWDDAKREAYGRRDVAAHVDWQDDPVGWIVAHLWIPRETLEWSLLYPEHEWDGTVDPLVKVAEALADWQDVGVESGTGTGKSFMVACLILWFLACHKGARVFSFAPKEDQLRLFIWSEMGKLWLRFKKHFPTAELTDLRIRMDGSDDWGAWGYAVGIRAGEDSATKAQGMHAEHMLLVYEETPGIPLPVMAAGENTATAPHNLRIAIGNPDHQADTLHTFCASPGVVHVRMSALDHPNVVTARDVIPGAVSTKAVWRRREKYGEGSRLYQSRVRGISPAEAEDALISWAWCTAAALRYDERDLRVGLLALGVDVANSEHGDLGAIARWQGACLTEVTSFPCPDASILGVNVHREMQGTDDPASHILAKHVGVDSVGVGASTVNKLKELGARVRSLNGGARALPSLDEDVKYADLRDENGEWKPDGPTVVLEERYNNLRSQMWWQMREDLRLGRVALPNDEELFRDLTTPTYETKNGKIVVEPKEKIRERLGRSPDKGDAAVYGNWVRNRRPTTKPDRQSTNRNVDNSGVLERKFAAAAKERKREEREEREWRRILKQSGKR